MMDLNGPYVTDSSLTIESAQKVSHFEINGQVYPRRKHDSSKRCRDCGAAKGQVHFPTCEVELCPRCSGSALLCPCDLVLRELH